MSSSVGQPHEAGLGIRRLAPRRGDASGSGDRRRGLKPVGPRNNLPAYTSTFVGRDREITEVCGLLTDARLVTLTGVGGIGKTRLALKVADRCAPAYPDGVWLLELASLREPDLVAETILAQLPDIDRSGRGAPDLVEQLRDRRMLLVLDNCEHLLDGCAPVVQKLVQSCPLLSVLVTSRAALAVDGEHAVCLGPLELPGPDDLDWATLGATDAVRLFVERARAVDPDIHLGAEIAPAVVEICRRVDGLPLGIELAAARLGVLSPAEIVERLDDRFRLLATRSRVAEGRHQTLRGTLEWSHELLDGPEAILLRRLGVFAGGWGLRGCEDVCAGGDIDRDAVLDLLEGLVAQSLVVVDRGGAVTRYRLLESVRQFALEKLESSGEADDLRERHAAWCVTRAERAERERRGRRHQAWLEALEEDHDNFRAALMWARDNQRLDMVLALGGALAWFWETRGHLREGLEWLTWAVSREPDESGELRAKALRGAGVMSWLLGDVASAVPLVEESVALFRKAGNEEEAAGCLCSQAFHLCGDPAHSLPMLEENVGRMRRTENYDALAHSLVSCGLAHFFKADAAGAVSYFDECLALPLGAVEPEVVAGALLGLGRARALLGDLDGAEAPFREALDLAVHTGDPDGRSTALSLIADVARTAGDYVRARSLLADASELVARGGAALSVARCMQFLARVEAAEGNFEAAQSLYDQSLAEPGAIEMPYHRVRSVVGLGETALAVGDTVQARQRFDEALAMAEENLDAQAVTRAVAGLASIACLSGDLDRAAKLEHRALAIAEEIGDQIAITTSLESLGALAVTAGRPEVAARLIGAADAARRGGGWKRSFPDEASHARVVELLEANGQIHELQQWWTEGAGMSLGEAVSYAAKGWGTKQRPSSGWESLTRAERDIVGLVTEGGTNREIGERLFISPRTVSTHLTHIYAKLGVNSRRDLARQAKSRSHNETPVPSGQHDPGDRRGGTIVTAG